MTDTEHALDVAILGGGLAGNLLARQLRRDVPDVSVGIFEKADAPRWKVGESTVEIASNYLVRKAGLAYYLFDQHLPKHGLRFFFDNEEKNAELTAMSEIGTDRAPVDPSFQIDRARFEADLSEMNSADGVETWRPSVVRQVEVGREGAPHRFTARSDAGERRFRARWLIDATGRASTLARQLDLRTEEPEHRISAVWGRFHGVRDIDSIRDDAWRRRTRYIARVLSTNHFCYPGYWIWFIPLGRGVTSVGLVGLEHVFRRGIRTPEGFRAFLDEHRAVASLLDGATSIDLEGHTQLAYGTKRFFSAERWGLVGDAAAFTDPFYSPGSDFIALQCDLLTDLIRRETGGEAPASMAERTDLYDAFMQSRWDATMRVYRGLYSTFGSYELMKVKFNFDLGCYFNLLFGPFACDWHLDLKYLKSELRRRRETGIIMGNFADLFRQVERHLWRNGAYHRGNLGRHDLGVECILPLIGEVTETRKKSLIDRRTEAIFNYGRGEALKLLGRDGVEPPLRIHEFADPRPLVSSMCEAAEQVSSHRAGRGK